MCDESQRISEKSWTREADPISKVGFMDGASDGQTSTFQLNFDKGYSQGFSIGLSIGYIEASRSIKKEESREESFGDPRRINCQMCLNINFNQDNNLYNIQKENNDELSKGLVKR